MARVTIGKLIISAEAKQWIDPDDLASAIERHRRGDCGQASFRTRLKNARFAARESGFESVHTDRRGNEFFILSDHEADPKCTVVNIRRTYRR